MVPPINSRVVGTILTCGVMVPPVDSRMVGTILSQIQTKNIITEYNHRI